MILAEVCCFASIPEIITSYTNKLLQLFLVICYSLFKTKLNSYSRKTDYIYICRSNNY